ncbi:unnamed protein product [Ixodes persulcatus]
MNSLISGSAPFSTEHTNIVSTYLLIISDPAGNDYNLSQGRIQRGQINLGQRRCQQRTDADPFLLSIFTPLKFTAVELRYNSVKFRKLPTSIPDCDWNRTKFASNKSLNLERSNGRWRE